MRSAILLGSFCIAGIASGITASALYPIGICIVVAAVLMTVGVVHRAAFRTDRMGIFAQWTNPGELGRIKLTRNEYWVISFGFGLLVGVLLTTIG